MLYQIYLKNNFPLYLVKNMFAPKEQYKLSFLEINDTNLKSNLKMK